MIDALARLAAVFHGVAWMRPNPAGSKALPGAAIFSCAHAWCPHAEAIALNRLRQVLSTRFLTTYGSGETWVAKVDGEDGGHKARQIAVVVTLLVAVHNVAGDQAGAVLYL
jgi:hypothetical protein